LLAPVNLRNKRQMFLDPFLFYLDKFQCFL
jgi:hypothetical protein